MRRNCVRNLSKFSTCNESYPQDILLCICQRFKIPNLAPSGPEHSGQGLFNLCVSTVCRWPIPSSDLVDYRPKTTFLSRCGSKTLNSGPDGFCKPFYYGITLGLSSGWVKCLSVCLFRKILLRQDKDTKFLFKAI